MRAESKDGRVQASHVLKSYLEALEIPFTQSACGVGLSIKSRTTAAEVRVVVRSAAANSVVDGTLEIDADGLVSPEVDRILAAIHAVTEASGYGRPDPLGRGEGRSHRITYHDAFEDVYLRGKLLLRTPNPSPEGMKKVLSFLPVIRRAANKALFRFKTPLANMGFGEQDLIDVGIMHTIVFLHHYAYDANETNNLKLLTEFLNQRFAELAKVSSKKGSNSAFTAFTNVGLHGQGKGSASSSGRAEDDTYDRFSSLEDDSASADADYEGGHYSLISESGDRRNLEIRADGFLGLEMYLDGRKLTSSEEQVLRNRVGAGVLTLESGEENDSVVEEGTQLSSNVRKNRARKELYRRLGEMDSEQLETVLAYASLSRDYAPDARAMARKLCDEIHCPQCKKKVSSGTRCFKCDVEAVPRFGVDYTEVRRKLAGFKPGIVRKLDKDGNTLEEIAVVSPSGVSHLMADAMSAAIPDSELRAKKRLAKAPDAASTAAATQLTKEEVSALAKRLAKECFDSLPENLTCTKCHGERPKANFGVRVPRCKKTGMPQKASKIPWCKKCRKEAK